jgi:hypothetical protein
VESDNYCENSLLFYLSALTKALAMNVEFLRRFGLRSAKTGEEHAMATEDNVKTGSSRDELIVRIVGGGVRKRRAPAEPRGVCLNCGKVGLGNTYIGRSASLGINGPYRQCRYCSECQKA